MSQEIPLACDLSVFTPEQRQHHNQLYEQISAARQSISELDDGYAFELPGELFVIAAEFIGLEHLCCPFLRLMLEVEPGQNSIWLHLRGSSQIKVFLQYELALA